MKHLLYSEYRIEQALWLQKTNSERTNYGVMSEQYYLDCYVDYLFICAAKKETISGIRDIKAKLNRTTVFSKPNPNYSEDTLKNVVEIVDKIAAK